jgi:hypothetical protein
MRVFAPLFILMACSAQAAVPDAKKFYDEVITKLAGNSVVQRAQGGSLGISLSNVKTDVWWPEGVAIRAQAVARDMNWDDFDQANFKKALEAVQPRLIRPNGYQFHMKEENILKAIQNYIGS